MAPVTQSHMNIPFPRKSKISDFVQLYPIKYAQDDLTIVDAPQIASHRVHHVLPILERESVLMVDGGDVDNNLCYATRNLQKVDVLKAQRVQYVTERQGGVEYWSCSIAGAEIVTGLCGLISALCARHVLHILLLVYAIQCIIHLIHVTIASHLQQFTTKNNN